MERKIQIDIPDLEGLPSEWIDIVKGCLIRDHNQRWGAMDVLTAIDSPLSKATVSSKSADEFFNNGLKKYNKKDLQGAIADYNEAIRLNLNYANAYMGRGLAKSELGDKQEAIADYNEAIHLNPNHTGAHFNRGLIKKQRGEKQEALADFRKAAELYQKQGDTEWYNKSRDRMRELRGG